MELKKGSMTFEDAASDPRRPLSLTPREWMYSVEAELAEEDQLVSKTAERIASENGTADKPDGLELIDLGLDQMVSGAKLLESGIRSARMLDMTPSARRAVEEVKDLLETALKPYLADAIVAADKLDEE